MTLERRAWWISRILVILLVVVSLRAAYWQLWRGLALQPVALDPVAAAREYARLRGEPTPAPGMEEAQAGQGEGLAALPQPVIQRTVQMLSTIQRGAILDRRGNVLAADSGTPGDYQRVYSEPSLAHVIGYTSALRTGINGLEATYNIDLLGLNRPDTEIDRLLRRPIYGSSLVLTIDSEIQRVAAEALAGRPGAVIALDGETGAVLAMTSAPTFDPNQILTDGYLASLGEGALINRATQALYTPGSTYKTVTLITALDSGLVKPDTIFDFGEPRVSESGGTYYVYEVDGGVIPDPNHKESRLDLTMSYALSANAAFAKMGDQLDPEVLIDYASRMGFSNEDYTRNFPFDLTVSPPQLANDLELLRQNNLLQASTGFGQGELLTTPFNMALVLEAVINEGNIPVPYLVESIRDPEGGVIRERPRHELVRGVMRRETAQQVKAIMESTVQRSYGGSDFIGIDGVTMGGKTGTAQVGGDQEPHSWFIGFAEGNSRKVVVVVVLEHGGGGGPAIPIFQAVARAAIQQMMAEGAR